MPSGLVPTGALSYGARLMYWLTVVAFGLMTAMRSVSVTATYRSLVTGLRTIAVGWVPTVMVARFDSVEASSTETVFVPQFDTYAVLPSAESPTVYGFGT